MHKLCLIAGSICQFAKEKFTKIREIRFLLITLVPRIFIHFINFQSNIPRIIFELQIFQNNSLWKIIRDTISVLQAIEMVNWSAD